MNTIIKKNLWWIISSIVLFIPIAFFVCNIDGTLSEKLMVGVVPFILLFVICAITGVIANKIKIVVLKILWIILGLAIYALVWFMTVICLSFLVPTTEEDYENRKEDFRDMIYREFDAEDYLDSVVGIQLPQYKIVDSECTYVTFPPAETEYNVNLKIHFPDGLPKSVWKEIKELASNEAPNPLSKYEAINKWYFDQDNKKTIHYKCEDLSNVGSTITFKSDCDTVYVTSYKW